MKKLLIFAAVLFGCGIARAQTALTTPAFPLTTPAFPLTTTALPLAAKINASKTVYRDFTLYRYASDGIVYKEYYNNHGRWLHTVLSYAGGQLPSSIRDRISAKHDDYSISWVDEIRSPGQLPVYRVELNSCKKLLIVQVNDSEMAQEAEYEK
jgi:hypothetical protein